MLNSLLTIIPTLTFGVRHSDKKYTGNIKFFIIAYKLFICWGRSITILTLAKLKNIKGFNINNKNNWRYNVNFNIPAKVEYMINNKKHIIYASGLINLSTDEILSTNLSIVSFLAILSSILVISTNNAVVSVLFLIGLFINVAIYLMLMGISFIGLTYIVVYVGAVTILFLFVIMLLDIKFSEIKDYNNDTFPLGLLIGLTFLYPLIEIIPKEIDNVKSTLSYFFNKLNSFIINTEITNNQDLETPLVRSENFENYIVSNISPLDLSKMDKIIINIWDNSLVSYTQISSIGQVMYNSHMIWFIGVSLILLLAMVGAISLTLRTTLTS